MRDHAIARITLATTLVFLSIGCTRKVVHTRPAIGTVFGREQQAGLSTDERANRDRNCLEGCPKLSADAGWGPTVLLYRKGYVLEHSSVYKIPVWVAEQVVREQIAGNEARSNNFQPDPLLKPGTRAELADYKRSGFDRGHQAPAGNQSVDPKLKDETFFLSNMCPQVPANNQKIWRALEDLTRVWVKRFGTAWEITGPLFWDSKEDDPTRATGSITFLAIGKNQVAVPTHFYKIVVAPDSDGRLQSIAFVIENKSFGNGPYDFSRFIQSISWIEKHTGLDFLSDMSTAEQRRLEQKPSDMWPVQ